MSQRSTHGKIERARSRPISRNWRWAILSLATKAMHEPEWLCVAFKLLCAKIRMRILTVWPLIAQQAGVDPENVSRLSQIFAQHPEAIDGLAEAINGTKASMPNRSILPWIRRQVKQSPIRSMIWAMSSS